MRIYGHSDDLVIVEHFGSESEFNGYEKVVVVSVITADPNVGVVVRLEYAPKDRKPAWSVMIEQIGDGDRIASCPWPVRVSIPFDKESPVVEIDCPEETAYAVEREKV